MLDKSILYVVEKMLFQEREWCCSLKYFILLEALALFPFPHDQNSFSLKVFLLLSRFLSITMKQGNYSDKQLPAMGKRSSFYLAHGDEYSCEQDNHKEAAVVFSVRKGSGLHIFYDHL